MVIQKYGLLDFCCRRKVIFHCSREFKFDKDNAADVNLWTVNENLKCKSLKKTMQSGCKSCKAQKQLKSADQHKTTRTEI